MMVLFSNMSWIGFFDRWLYRVVLSCSVFTVRHAPFYALFLFIADPEIRGTAIAEKARFYHIAWHSP